MEEIIKNYDSYISGMKKSSADRYTDRQWIKEYERMKSNGELDFMDKYI